MKNLRRKLLSVGLIAGLSLLLVACNDGESSTGSSSSGGKRLPFNLVFDQTYQACASCGIWFDSVQLVVKHSAGTYTSPKSGSMLVKARPYSQGRFKADLSSIPENATIHSATLYMRLHPHEGIANSDNSSVITAYDVNGPKTKVRDISARHDIKGKGYNKGNPNIPVDFTKYTQQL